MNLVAFAALASILSVSSGTGTNVTAGIQREIDALAASGGGVLVVPAGEYVVASLELKDRVSMRLERGAYLYGSANRADYRIYPNKGDSNSAVVFADGAEDVSVEGEGVIDGRGFLHDRYLSTPPPRSPLGPQPLDLEPGSDALYFHACRRVRVEGVTLRNPSSWCCFFRGCDGVTVRKVKIYNHNNPSNDGMDIESSNVLVEDCDIDSEDDPLVLKAREPGRVVENVVVRRCRLSSNAEHIKIGTETLGTFRNVLIEDCDVACRTPKGHTDPWLWIPGVETVQSALSAISLFLVDGGSVEDVTIRRINVGEGILTPICIRCGARKPRRLPGKSFFRNVLVEDVKMSVPTVGAVACSVTGVPELRPSGITFRNLDLKFKGGGRPADAAQKIVDEHADAYPAPYHVFRSKFPAYAFYLRHADNIRFENVRTTVADPLEARLPVVAEDATYVVDGCSFECRVAD